MGTGAGDVGSECLYDGVMMEKKSILSLESMGGDANVQVCFDKLKFFFINFPSQLLYYTHFFVQYFNLTPL